MNTVRIYQRLEDLPNAYQALFADADVTATAFQTLPWFRNLVATSLEKNAAVRIYGVESGGPESTPSIVLPMCAQVSKRTFFSPRKLTALSNFYSPLFSPLCGTAMPESPAECAQFFQPLINAIAAERPRWDTIDLRPMAADAATIDGLTHAFRAVGMAVQRYFCFGNWYLDVNGRSFPAYFETLPSKLRNTLKRKTAQLKAANRLHLHIYSACDGLDEGIKAYEQIYGASWKTPEAYPAFMPGLIRTCAEQGWLRLGVASIDGQPAAAQLWIVHNGVASIFKLAYDAQFSALSVGSILTAHLMQHVIDVDRVREVDYLTGDDAYKQDWMSHRRERVGLIAFNLRTLHGLLAACKQIGGRALKKVFRTIKPR